MRLLDAAGIEYKVIELKAKKGYGSAAETAAQNGLDSARIFKTLTAEGERRGVLVAVVPGDKQLNAKATAKHFADKKVTMLPLKDLTRTTGYVRGGCSPVGMVKSYPTVIDVSANDFDTIYVNAGKRGLLMEIAPADLARICDADFAQIAE